MPENYGFLIWTVFLKKTSELKEEILKECSRRELRERQRNKTLIVSSTTNLNIYKRGLASPKLKSNSFNEPKIKRQVCSRYSHWDKNGRTWSQNNLKRVQRININSYVTEFADNDCYEIGFHTPC